MTRGSRREYAWLALVLAVLVAAVFLVRANAAALKAFIDQNPFWGVFLYIVLNILDAVVAPGATLPLIPVAAHAWGRVPAALITMVGWTTGSLIAFLIARRWGYPMVKTLTSMERLRKMKRFIPENLFLSIVLLRLVMPMDVMSYLLGLFTDIGWSKYMLASALGLAPSAFVLTYLGKLPHAYEIIAFGVGGAIFVASMVVSRARTRKATARATLHRARDR